MFTNLSLLSVLSLTLCTIESDFIQSFCANPDNCIKERPDYITVITNDIYVTVTDTEIVDVCSFVTDYSTSTICHRETSSLNETAYYTKTSTFITTEYSIITDVSFSCSTETVNTSITHISTVVLTKTKTNIEIITSVPYTTIYDQKTTTNYSSICLIDITTSTDTLTATLSVTMCDAYIIPKNIEELTNSMIEFQAEQQNDLDDYINGSSNKKIRLMSLNNITTITPPPFNFELLLQFNPYVTEADVAEFKNMILSDLYVYQQKSLALLQQGGSIDMQTSLNTSFIRSELNKWRLFVYYKILYDNPAYQDLELLVANFEFFYSTELIKFLNWIRGQLYVI